MRASFAESVEGDSEDASKARLQVCARSPSPINSCTGAVSHPDACVCTVQVLDRRLLYLRLVHTCCYYSMVVAEDEDDLLRRACSLYVRGKDHLNPDGMRRHAPVMVVAWSVADSLNWSRAAFCRNIDETLAVLLSHKLPDAEIKILGLKDTEAEVAAAYKKNIIMMDVEKFKCGLDKCNKMFKGSDFVKKHIQNKHPEIEKTVRNKCELLNNYLRDRHRPSDQPLEHDGFRPPGGMPGLMMGAGPGPFMPGPGGPFPPRGPPMMPPPGRGMFHT